MKVCSTSFVFFSLSFWRFYGWRDENTHNTQKFTTVPVHSRNPGVGGEHSIELWFYVALLCGTRYKKRFFFKFTVFFANGYYQTLKDLCRFYTIAYPWYQEVLKVHHCLSAVAQFFFTFFHYFVVSRTYNLIDLLWHYYHYNF